MGESRRSKYEFIQVQMGRLDALHNITIEHSIDYIFVSHNSQTIFFYENRTHVKYVNRIVAFLVT